MAARVPRLANAAIEFGFVTLAFVLGAVGVSIWALPALALAMIAYWAFNRRTGLAQLREMGGAKLVGAAAISIALISAVLAAAYWIGTLASGWFPLVATSAGNVNVGLAF